MKGLTIRLPPLRATEGSAAIQSFRLKLGDWIATSLRSSR